MSRGWLLTRGLVSVDRPYEAADVRSLASRMKQRNTIDRSAPALASPSPTDRITIAAISTSSTTCAPLSKSRRYPPHASYREASPRLLRNVTAREQPGAAIGGTPLAVNSDSIARRPIWEATPTHRTDGRRNEPPDTPFIREWLRKTRRSWPGCLRTYVTKGKEHIVQSSPETSRVDSAAAS
jgi:hypothetical protein